MARFTRATLLLAAAVAGGLVAGCSGGPEPWADGPLGVDRPIAPPPTIPSTGGNPTLTYWTAINSVPARLAADLRNGLEQPAWAFRDAAGELRDQPTLGVDPDLVRWALRMADLLAERANRIEHARTPAATAGAAERGTRGDFDGAGTWIAEERASRARYRSLHQEWFRLRAALTARHGVEFP